MTDDKQPTPYVFIDDLIAQADMPRRGIHSQTLSEGGGVELVLFAMAAGERLSEHTAARPAIVHCLTGDATLVVAGDTHEMHAGSWLRMEPRTPHSIVALTPLVFGLYLLPA